MKKKIMAIGAHYDDIELACGGTLAKFVKDGCDVKMVVVTDSIGKSYTGAVMRTIEQAETEGKNAANILGVMNLENLGFINKETKYDYLLVEAIEKQLVDFKPDLIFTHWPSDTHQDHHNVGLAATSAARNFNNIIFFEPFPPSGRSYATFRPNFYSDISETIDLKINSIKAHISQHARYGDDWIEAISGRARMRGFESNCKYAEAFEVLRFELKI